MIRKAEKADLDAVYGLVKQLSRHKFSKEQFEGCYHYNIGRGNVLVYEKDNLVRGFAVFSIYYPLHFSRITAEVVNLVVDKNSRGGGIGKELLAAIEQIASDNGCVYIEVASSKRREAAHRFYEREGFESTHYKLTKELAL